MTGGFAAAVDGLGGAIVKAAAIPAKRAVRANWNTNLFDHFPHMRQAFAQRPLEKEMIDAIGDDLEPLGQIILRPDLVRGHHARNLAVPLGSLNDGIDRKQVFRVLELPGNAHEIR